MDSQSTERRLAAIMFTDIVGYTALMAESEAKGRLGRSAGRTFTKCRMRSRALGTALSFCIS